MTATTAPVADPAGLSATSTPASTSASTSSSASADGALTLPPLHPDRVPVRQVEPVTLMANRWWTARQDRVVFTNATGGDGPDVEGSHVVFEPGCGVRAGTVIIPVRPGPAGDEIALVHIFRYPLGIWVWELPRGAADAEDTDAVMTATRELLEETGATPLSADHIGQLHPDTGPMRSVVDVVLARVAPVDTEPLDVTEVAAIRWVDLATVSAAIADGSLRCGLSIAALAQAQIAGLIGPLPRRER